MSAGPGAFPLKPLPGRVDAPAVSTGETGPETGSARPRPAGGLVVGTPEQFRWLGRIVKAVLLLNLLDAIFTLVWVFAGLAREGNPLMADLIHGHPVIFAVCKLTLVGLGSQLLWTWRERPLAVVAIFLGFLVYYDLLLVHLSYLSWILGGLLGT